MVVAYNYSFITLDKMAKLYRVYRLFSFISLGRNKNKRTYAMQIDDKLDNVMDAFYI